MHLEAAATRPMRFVCAQASIRITGTLTGRPGSSGGGQGRSEFCDGLHAWRNPDQRASSPMPEFALPTCYLDPISGSELIA